MCLGNRAEASAYYINRQLSTLWSNAQTCANKHATGLKPTHSEVEYGTCLYEFYGPGKHLRKGGSKEDLSFYAQFGAPRLEFVCNHEVILFLEIKDGHYNFDTNNTSAHVHHEHIDEYTLAYRLDFNIASIEGFACKSIGNADDYTLNLFILDFATANLCPELSSVANIGFHDPQFTALSSYITTYYFPLLKRAGHHVLYSLPDFDNLTSTSAHIDYTAISPRNVATDALHGIRVNEINTYLRSLWLQAATTIDEHGFDNPKATQGYLVEHQSIWTQVTEDINFRILFGPMEVQPLCKREVVLTVDIQDVYFYLGGVSFDRPHQHHFVNWKIPFVVDVTFQQDNTGNVRRLKLDLPSARFYEPLSTMEVPTDVNPDLLFRMRSSLIRYITTQYLRIIYDAGYQEIYHHDPRIHGPTTQDEPEVDDSEDDGCYCVGVCSCGASTTTGPRNGILITAPSGKKEWMPIRWDELDCHRVRDTTTSSYDQITAVTQGTLNVHFRTIYDIARRKVQTRTMDATVTVEETCLADYVYFTGKGSDRVIYFDCTFGAPQLQLLPSQASTKTVVLYLELLDGKMRPVNRGNILSKDGELMPFNKWRIAFEVPLRLEDCSAARPAPADLLQRLKRTSHSTFKQLFLDIPNARFSMSRSKLPGLLDGKNPRSIRDKHNAIIYYLTTFYLPAFVGAGHDVLYTIPMFDGTPDSVSPLTSLSFQIVPFVVGPSRQWVEGLFGPQRPLYDRNQIVFTGMFGRRPLPTGPSAIITGGNCVSGGMTGGKNAVQHGTIVISRKTFLEDKILALFSRINRETTVLPSFSGIQPNGEWLLKLTTWDKHESKRTAECKWRQLPGTDNSLDFEWRNREEWRYEHEGDEGNNGWYSVTCNTRNLLSVPVVYLHDGSLAIVIRGIVDLKLAYSGNSKSWDSAMQARWALSINFVSDSARGVVIHTSPATIVPEFRGQHEHGTLGHSTFAQTFQDLKNQLPMAFNFNRVVDELHATLNGVQTQFYVASKDQILVNPTFNLKGDLLVELQVRGATLPAARIDFALRPAELEYNIMDWSDGISTPTISRTTQAMSQLGNGRPGQQQSRAVSLALSTSSLSSQPRASAMSPRKSYSSAPRSGNAFAYSPSGNFTPAGETITWQDNRPVPA